MRLTLYVPNINFHYKLTPYIYVKNKAPVPMLPILLHVYLDSRVTFLKGFVSNLSSPLKTRTLAGTIVLEHSAYIITLAISEMWDIVYSLPYIYCLELGVLTFNSTYGHFENPI
jgi:hypothetical protein